MTLIFLPFFPLPLSGVSAGEEEEEERRQPGLLISFCRRGKFWLCVCDPCCASCGGVSGFFRGFCFGGTGWGGRFGVTWGFISWGIFMGGFFGGGGGGVFVILSQEIIK